MPLRDQDIELLSLSNRSTQLPGSAQFVNVKEIIFRVRGQQETIYIPLTTYTKDIGEQAILRAAADIVELLERFPRQG